MKLLPNILSLIRILFVPFILWLIISNLFFFSAIIITIVGITDFFDGYIARKYKNETKVGFYLDAVADKILIVTICLILGIKLLIPLYLIIIILFRELMIAGSYMFGFALNLSHNLRPIFISKLNTFLQILLIIVVCLSSVEYISELYIINIIKNSLLAMVVITTIASSFRYIIVWSQAVNVE